MDSLYKISNLIENYSISLFIQYLNNQISINQSNRTSFEDNNPNKNFILYVTNELVNVIMVYIEKIIKSLATSTY